MQFAFLLTRIFPIGSQYPVICRTQVTIAPANKNRHNPIGKIFSKDELQAVGDLCVKNNVIILSDEVLLTYTLPPSPFVRFPH